MHERLPVHTAEREVNMINRNEVAREKMQRAAEMLQDNNIDMWVFYARLKTDTALELMFNTDSIPGISDAYSPSSNVLTAA